MGRESFQPTSETPKPSKLRQLVGETEQLSFQRAQFPQFLEKLQKVGIGDLLQDRVAQAKLDVLLDAYSKRRDYSQTLRRPSDIPMVVLKEKRKKRDDQKEEDVRLGATLFSEHHRFQLNDGEFLYYFSTRQPEDASKYLRDQDIVPPGDYKSWRRQVTEPFAKPINRVPLDEEGPAESFNYHSGKWEKNGEGTHTGRGTRNNRMPR